MRNPQSWSVPNLHPEWWARLPAAMIRRKVTLNVKRPRRVRRTWPFNTNDRECLLPTATAPRRQVGHLIVELFDRPTSTFDQLARLFAQPAVSVDHLF